MLLVAVKSVLLLGLGLIVAALLRRRSAALRRGVLAVTVLAALALPGLSGLAALLPPWHAVDLPAPSVAVRELPLAAQSLGWASEPDAATPQASATSVGAGADASTVLVVLAGLWALGGVFFVGRLGFGWGAVRRIARRAESDRAWQDACASLCAELGVARAPAVRLSADAGAPLVTGTLRPIILIPTSMRDWSPDGRRLVLLHELAHVAAHDCLLVTASHLMRALYWPNPLAWLVQRRLVELGERAADDAALRAGVRGSTYAQGLLDAARGARRVPAGAVAMARGTKLEQRLRAVLATNRRREPLTRRAEFVLGGLALAMTTLVACVARTNASERTQPVAPQGSSAQLGAASAAPSTSNAGVDPRVQAIVDDEAPRMLALTRAAWVTVVVLDAPSGRVLGAHDAQRVVAPGATIRPLVVAAGLVSGLPADVRFDGEGGQWKHDGFVLRDSRASAELDLTKIVVRSSNVGTAKIAERIGPNALRGFLARVGLGGGLPATLTTRRADCVAAGMCQSATPLQVATAYTALADDGVIALPSRHHERVMPANVARAVRGMLERAVTDPDGTGGRARIRGVRVAGKTGTAPLGKHKYYPSFVGIVPAGAPRYVVLVGVDDPKGYWYGSRVAGLFARIARRVLALR